jgi:hypothetical protein
LHVGKLNKTHNTFKCINLRNYFLWIYEKLKLIIFVQIIFVKKTIFKNVNSITLKKSSYFLNKVFFPLKKYR